VTASQTAPPPRGDGKCAEAVERIGVGGGVEWQKSAESGSAICTFAGHGRWAMASGGYPPPGVLPKEFGSD
jgi:hypothetical protein